MRLSSTGPAKPEVSIVITASTGERALLPDCLRSIKETLCGLSYEVILVDNRSEDGCGAYVLSEVPDAVVLSPPARSGFGRNMNLGMSVSRGRFVMIANPDVRLLDGCTQELVAFLERTADAGIAAPQLLNADGSLQASCRRFHTWGSLILRRGPWARRFANSHAVRRFMMADWDHSSEADIDWAIGACLLVRREALEQVGGFDERFFLYFDDVDWCLRMHKAGWRVCYVPQARAIHFYRQESAKSVISSAGAHHFASLVKFVFKHRGRLGLPCKYRD
ncbi:MAG: glycosyltransferase family 2 protein [Armatimonadota bacterium]